jgi:hypothetical protein
MLFNLCFGKPASSRKTQIRKLHPSMELLEDCLTPATINADAQASCLYGTNDKINFEIPGLGPKREPDWVEGRVVGRLHRPSRAVGAAKAEHLVLSASALALGHVQQHLVKLVGGQAKEVSDRQRLGHFERPQEPHPGFMDHAVPVQVISAMPIYSSSTT